MQTTWIVVLLGLCSFTNGANILFFFGVSTYSHRIGAWPLVEALVERGHKVTFLQSEENKNPNPKVEELVLNSSSLVPSVDFLQLKLQYGNMMMPMMIHFLPQLGELVCRETLSDPNIMKFINTRKIDVVVVDALFNDCSLGLAHKWGAQVVLFGTSTIFEWWPDDFGFSAENNWIANTHFGQEMPLSFFGRVFSTIMTLYFRIIKVVYLFPRLEVMLREKLNMPNMPSLTELSSTPSLILMNTHFSEELSRSLPPMIIPVGGMHCTDKVQPIPKDMEEFINGSKDGFIYVSFGGEIKIANGPKHLRDAFFNAFKNSKARFIWKWEGPRPSDMPSNVFIASWVPQQSVLAHPKIKLFMTHGGLLSIQEALHNAVPMISFPIFAEQDYNAERIHRTKRGIRLHVLTVTQKDIEDAIHKILTDDTYRKSVKTASKLFKDRPMPPVESAVWWMEYVMRNKEDAHILRPLAWDQYWFQRRLLDVWAFIAAVLLLNLFLFVVIIKKFYSGCCGKKTMAGPAKKATKAKKQQ